MFLRFILNNKHPDTGVETGVFSTAYALRGSGQLLAHEQQDLDALLEWFEANLEIPTRFGRTRSKGYYRRVTKGIAWFKATAMAHLSRMRRLVAILEEHGHQVSMIKLRNPGYIVYEDAHQIIAEPFRDQRS